MAKLIPTIEVAKEKGCSRNAVIDAIRAKKLDGEQLSRYFYVKDNRKLSEWQPNAARQKAGKESQSGRKRKRAKKARSK